MRACLLFVVVVCLHVATCSEPCVDLDEEGCRHNPHICEDIILAKAACPAMCELCPNDLHTTTAATNAPSAKLSTCPNNWELFQGSCYYFKPDFMEFNDSELFCNLNNGHLVHIDNAAEQAFVTNRILNINRNQSWWIGLRDTEVEGVYRWVDTDEVLAPPMFIDWEPTQPLDAYNIEDCVGLWWARSMLWNDMSCKNKFPSICELSVGQLAVVIG
ncbi:perlucin-like protein [Mya arenaria]|uniref:perlucin-like protein n=1 Tax=Mya arenaria TaxID=6604 RepID=UPI0022E993FD|nr:perlucin-like protein [Mya arenaria]